eukprot:GHVL01023587.1.p1 GENE.GHVL01023587.1~~GHVL01023587.1.p1  ORF type:complete len:432 (+),score=81.47 GHVL01023587.1:109-1404(+)
MFRFLSFAICLLLPYANGTPSQAEYYAQFLGLFEDFKPADEWIEGFKHISVLMEAMKNDQTKESILEMAEEYKKSGDSFSEKVGKAVLVWGENNPTVDDVLKDSIEELFEEPTTYKGAIFGHFREGYSKDVKSDKPTLAIYQKLNNAINAINREMVTKSPLMNDLNVAVNHFFFHSNFYLTNEEIQTDSRNMKCFLDMYEKKFASNVDVKFEELWFKERNFQLVQPLVADIHQQLSSADEEVFAELCITKREEIQKLYTMVELFRYIETMDAVNLNLQTRIHNTVLRLTRIHIDDNVVVREILGEAFLDLKKKDSKFWMPALEEPKRSSELMIKNVTDTNKWLQHVLTALMKHAELIIGTPYMELLKLRQEMKPLELRQDMKPLELRQDDTKPKLFVHDAPIVKHNKTKKRDEDDDELKKQFAALGNFNIE